MKMLTRLQVVELLKKRQGDRAARALAAELGISETYLSEIYKGNREPGPAVIEKMGLRREVIYRAS